MIITAKSYAAPSPHTHHWSADKYTFEMNDPIITYKPGVLVADGSIVVVGELGQLASTVAPIAAPPAACGWLSSRVQNERAVFSQSSRAEAVALMIEIAADLIERYGWVQLRSFNSDGFCVTGAVSHVQKAVTDALMTDGMLCWDAARALVRHGATSPSVAGTRLSSDWYQVQAWNDRSDRTKDEVLEVMRKAANKVREMGI